MNAFKKLRFPKTSLALFIIGALIAFTIPVRVMLGASINLPPRGSDIETTVFQNVIIAILVIGLSFLILNLLLWFFLRKKGIKFMDLMYPVSTLGAIAIFIYFHIALFA